MRGRVGNTEGKEKKLFHPVGSDLCHQRGKRSWVYTHARAHMCARTHALTQPMPFPLAFLGQGAKPDVNWVTATPLSKAHL